MKTRQLAADILTAFQHGDFEQVVQMLESERLHLSFDKTPAHYIDISEGIIYELDN